MRRARRVGCAELPGLARGQTAPRQPVSRETPALTGATAGGVWSVAWGSQTWDAWRRDESRGEWPRWVERPRWLAGVYARGLPPASGGSDSTVGPVVRCRNSRCRVRGSWLRPGFPPSRRAAAGTRASADLPSGTVRRAEQWPDARGGANPFHVEPRSHADRGRTGGPTSEPRSRLLRSRGSNLQELGSCPPAATYLRGRGARDGAAARHPHHGEQDGGCGFQVPRETALETCPRAGTPERAPLSGTARADGTSRGGPARGVGRWPTRVAPGRIVAPCQ